MNNNDDTITDRGSTAGMEYGLDWICQNTATYRAPLEIFSLSSTVGLSTSSSSSSSASLSSFSSSASGLATPARTTSPPQCSDHSTDRDIGQSRSVTMMMIGNDDNPFRDQKKVISGFSPQGERGLVLRPGLTKRPGGRGQKRPCRVL